MIEPQYNAFRSHLRRPRTEAERLGYQIAAGKVRVGPDAARAIARRIEQQHGFWDFPERRTAA